MPLSNAERQKAYRERQREEQAADAIEAKKPQKESRPPSPPLSLDDYLKENLYMAELHHSQTSPNATESTKSLADQLERAETYARWRYAEFFAGAVNGL